MITPAWRRPKRQQDATNRDDPLRFPLLPLHPWCQAGQGLHSWCPAPGLLLARRRNPPAVCPLRGGPSRSDLGYFLPKQRRLVRYLAMYLMGTYGKRPVIFFPVIVIVIISRGCGGCKDASGGCGVPPADICMGMGSLTGREVGVITQP
jgi:hypothetical protein